MSFDPKVVESDRFMQEALELDGAVFPNFGARTSHHNAMLSGAQLFRARLLQHANEPERGICRYCGNTIERLPWIPHNWTHRDFSAGVGSGYLGEDCPPLPRTQAAPTDE